MATRTQRHAPRVPILLVGCKSGICIIFIDNLFPVLMDIRTLAPRVPILLVGYKSGICIIFNVK